MLQNAATKLARSQDFGSSDSHSKVSGRETDHKEDEQIPISRSSDPHSEASGRDGNHKAEAPAPTSLKKTAADHASLTAAATGTEQEHTALPVVPTDTLQQVHSSVLPTEN